MSNNKKIGIAWCDNGTVNSEFMKGMIEVIEYIIRHRPDIDYAGTISVVGNMIPAQRERVMSIWENQKDVDWLLWVDSDVVLNISIFNSLINSIDEEERPIVSGVYYISYNRNGTMMNPVPAVFLDKGYKVEPIEPLPDFGMIQADSAGMGLVIMHRSIINQIRSKYDSFFDITVGEKHIGEDISFFRKVKDVGIPLYVNVEATAKHMKTFSFDKNYYNLIKNRQALSVENPTG